MKFYTLILFFLITISHLSCDGQANNTSNIPKEKIMNTEVFDIAYYEKQKKEQLTTEMLNPWTIESFLSDGTKQELYSSMDNNITYFKSITPPKPALLKTVKRYHSNGKIALEYKTYVGILTPYPYAEYTLFGETKYFDTNGFLIKIENNEKLFDSVKINLIELFSILEKERIIDEFSIEDKKKLQKLFFKNNTLEEITPLLLIHFLQQNHDKDKGVEHNINGYFLNKNDEYDRKSLEISYNNKIWYVKKDFYPFGWVQLEIDSATGRNIIKKYYFENRN